jgi:hypothetical protein
VHHCRTLQCRTTKRQYCLQSGVFVKQRPTTSTDPGVVEYTELTVNGDVPYREYTLDKASNTIVITYEQKRANGHQQVTEQYVANQVFLPTDAEKACYTAVIKPLIEELCSDDTTHSIAAVVLMGQSGNADT